jgi:hypothetical protein
VATLTKPKIIGCVSCDSGTLAVIDPSHLGVTQNGAVSMPAWNLFTSVNTEIGDGEFTVHEQRDSRGKLKRIVIELE